MSDELLSVREVARLCGKSEETVRRWIWSGKLRAQKLGNQLFVERADLEAMRAPRAAESAALYRTSAGHESPAGEYPLKVVDYDVDEVLASLRRIQKIGDELVEKRGYIDVTELIYAVREDDE